MYKIPGVNQIPAELLQTEGNKVRYEINEFVNYIWKKEEMAQQLKGSTTISI
jgi:hypothetical protein